MVKRNMRPPFVLYLWPEPEAPVPAGGSRWPSPRPNPLWLWFFALQGANQNLSAFSTARLDAARISRDPSKKSPCTTCIPTASGLAFRPPGCEPKPVRFFSPLTRDSPYRHQPHQESAVHG